MNNRGVFSNSRFYREINEIRNDIMNEINQGEGEPNVEILHPVLNRINEILADEEMPDVLHIGEIQPVEINEDDVFNDDDSSSDEDDTSDDDDSEEEVEIERENIDTFKGGCICTNI